MEALYSKLYDKYTRLKANKASEIDQYNFDQEQKFKVYVSAADELIDHLNAQVSELRQELVSIRSAKDEEQEKYERMLVKENLKTADELIDPLNAQVSELRQELASIRSAKDEAQEKYERMLLKQNLKIKELSEENERLNRREFHSSTSNEMVPLKQVSSSPLSSGKTNKSTMRKRRRNSIDQHENILLEEPHDAVEKENMILGVIDDANQPKCCRRRLGNSVNATDSSMCMFQELVENLLDLKFSVATQSDDKFITVVHDSSGYTFNLGYMKNATGEEELMYTMSSLGTFERVAPEWMRDVMLFNKRMSRMFFKRVSTVLKLHH